MRCLFYIIALLFLSACGYSASQTEALDDARRLMHTDAGAALSELNSIDVSGIKDSATMAQWALLYSEALAANRLAAPTDTIVDIAIDYYGRHNMQPEYQKASHLKALLAEGGTDDSLASALYLQKEKEYMLYKERVKRQYFMAASLFILILAAGIIVWMRQRLRLQYLQNEALIAEASGLECRINASRGHVERLESKLHTLFENRFSLIDTLCQTYYESQGTKTERKAVADKVRNEIDSLRTASMPMLEQTVNDCLDDILIKTKNCYPDIKPEDYRLLVYLASGLSTRTISLLIGESVEVVYKRKSRLKSRLKENAGQSCPEIMTVF